MTALYQRLNLSRNMWAKEPKLEAVEIAKQLDPNASFYERAWQKFEVATTLNLLALACYYSGEHELARRYGLECLTAAEGFFFGEWREVYQTPEGKNDKLWWNQHFVWMQAFEAAVLWGSVLSKWEFLERLGRFPREDSCVSDGYTKQDLSMFLAWAALLRNVEAAHVASTLLKSKTRYKERCHLLVSAFHFALHHGSAELNQALHQWLVFYQRYEFPKEKVNKKISIEATFFVHWAENKGLQLKVEPRFLDHIVRI